MAIINTYVIFHLTTIIGSSVVIDRKITQQLMNPVPPELSEVSAGLAVTSLLA